MATPTEMIELERGDGVWENVQVFAEAVEVLRFGFRSLWKAFAGVDSRIMELGKALTAQQNDSQRQRQHLEAIAKTLSVMSEQLRLGQDEAANQQIEARLQNLENQLHDQLGEGDDSSANKANITKVEHRLDLLEEEMGHVVTAIDKKADAEALVEQGKALQKSIRRRCKKEAFDQEVLGLQRRLQQQREELEKQLSVSFLGIKTAQETLVHSECASWAAKTHENISKSAQLMIDQLTQQQTETLRAISEETHHCYEAFTAQQKQIDEFQAGIEKQVRSAVAADQEDIARQCSEAHGRIDYQFRTQEESLERIRGEQRVLQEAIAATGSERAEQTMTEIAAAVGALDRLVLDREHQELEKLRGQLTEEIQLTLKALEPAKDKEQRKLKQHQHVVARKLAELDQMMQLIGRQLIQNTSQLQVVRNEQLVHNFHLDMHGEEPANDDNELLLQYDNIARSTDLAGVPQAPVFLGLQQADQIETGDNEQTADTATAELQARRSLHQELQEQLDKKLHDYSQLLDSANDDEETLPQSTQPPKE